MTVNESGSILFATYTGHVSVPLKGIDDLTQFVYPNPPTNSKPAAVTEY